MQELVYDTPEIADLCRKQWPNAKIEDASDYIHENRFEIEVDVSEKEFYHFALANHFLMGCLKMRIDLYTPRHDRNVETNILIDGILEEIRKHSGNPLAPQH